MRVRPEMTEASHLALIAFSKLALGGAAFGLLNLPILFGARERGCHLGRLRLLLSFGRLCWSRFLWQQMRKGSRGSGGGVVVVACGVVWHGVVVWK